MFLLSFIMITSVAYYLLTTRFIMLGQSTSKCIIILLEKKVIVGEINLIHVNTKD